MLAHAELTTQLEQRQAWGTEAAGAQNSRPKTSDVTWVAELGQEADSVRLLYELEPKRKKKTLPQKGEGRIVAGAIADPRQTFSCPSGTSEGNAEVLRALFPSVSRKEGNCRDLVSLLRRFSLISMYIIITLYITVLWSTTVISTLLHLLSTICKRVG